MKFSFIGILLFLSTLRFGQIIESKVVNNGGNGQYKAIVTTEETLQDLTIYRSGDLKYTVKREGNFQ
jgi:hypothetical protein